VLQREYPRYHSDPLTKNDLSKLYALSADAIRRGNRNGKLLGDPITPRLEEAARYRDQFIALLEVHQISSVGDNIIMCVLNDDTKDGTTWTYMGRKVDTVS
jgi:hypothetical protein